MTVYMIAEVVIFERVLVNPDLKTLLTRIPMSSCAGVLFYSL